MRSLASVVLGFALILASVALFPASASAAKIELRNKTAFKSSSLNSLRDSFQMLVAESEQATYEKETAVSRGAEFGFAVVSQKSGEAFEQVIKQALYQARPKLGARQSDVMMYPKELLENLVGETAGEGMSWNDGSGPDMFLSAFQEISMKPEIVLYSALSKGAGGTDHFAIVFDSNTGEAFALGSEFDQ